MLKKDLNQMNLVEFLNFATNYPSLYKLENDETDWIFFTQFDLQGTQLLVIDASFVPDASNGLLIELSPGSYQIDAKATKCNDEYAISRLRVVRLNTTAQCRAKIGETWTDTALTGICDYQTFSLIWEKDAQAAWNKIASNLNSSAWAGIAVLDKDAGAVMPFVQSGAGDGIYPVFELSDNQVRVGIEIEFLVNILGQ
jgi:hypothetical protein